MERLIERLLGRPFLAPEGEGGAGAGGESAGGAKAEGGQGASGEGNGGQKAEGGEKAAQSGKEGQGGTERGADGKFAAKTEKAAEGQSEADWRAGITDPELAEFAKRVASPIDGVKSAYDLRKKISSMVKLPTKDSKPEEIEQFRKAIGAGENVEAYVAAFPKPKEGEPTETDIKVQAGVAEVLMKHNVPVTVVPELAGIVQSLASEIEAENERVALKARTESEAALKKEWGGDFEANKNLAIRAIQAFGSEGLKAVLNDTHINGQKLGDHPELIRVFGQIGRRMGEGEFIGAVGAGERESLKAELERLYRENPVGTDKFNDPAVQKRMREINESMYGTAPVVGMGRAV